MTVRPYLRHPAYFLIVLCALGNNHNALAAPHIDSTRPASERDALLAVAQFAYLQATDFSFRDDYTELDSFTLRRFLEVNKSPLTLSDYAQLCREKADEGATAILKLAAEETQQHTAKKSEGVVVANPRLLEGVNLYYRDIDLNNLLSRLYSFVTATIPAAQESTLSQLTREQRVFLGREFKQLLTQDPDAAKRSANELDSAEQAERRDVERFVTFGHRIRPEFAIQNGVNAVIEILEAVRSYRDGVTARDRKPEQILSTDVELTPRSSAPYLGKTPGWVINGAGNDTYRGEYSVIIDLGGDDIYDLSYDLSDPHPCVVIDMGGNDVYSAATDFALGAGGFSLGLLVDMAGDDSYLGKSFGVGAGYFGVGVIYDSAGNDRYLMDTFGEGAGAFGVGMVVDENGDDLYQGAAHCQAFGFTRGFGAIVDTRGNDRYISGAKYSDFLRYDNHYLTMSQGFGYGYRPYMSGGIGALCDLAGNDVYVADIFGQGASYWKSIGVLCDVSGDDIYTAHQYAQGSGAHMTHGILLDLAGDDSYRSKGVSQGCGHDYSFGLLSDRAGADTYVCADLSQGAGSANGIGALIDFTGADRYMVVDSANTHGYGNPRREFGSIGLFIDAGGVDDYGRLSRENHVRRDGGRWGVAFDGEWRSWFPTSQMMGNKNDE